MIPELGHFSLVLALFVALAQGLVPLAGAARRSAAQIRFARPAARTQFALVVVSFGCLTWAFVNSDFSVQYVAQHSNSQLPIVYRFAAVWGGHEGSLLLWALLLAGWTFAVTLFSRALPDDMVARVLGVLGLVSAGFLLFILLTSNPFDRLLPAPDDGRDLNPLLQDPGLVLHPPMLYMGYVGFSIAFAFAIAAMLSGRLDAAWARWSRPWTTAAWVFMTLGIALGSWWAYYELGWGGWWFWDPVENASFMPWLAGTALIHSLAATEKRGAFRSWTVLLAIAAFSLSLLGTFLVRSGVLTSVHAFATDPRRGIFILLLLALVIGGSLALFAVRAPRMPSGGTFAPLSRETLLLSNNVLLVVATLCVMLGTLYPLLIDALGLGKLSVGPPYFNAVFVPVMVPVLLLMALGPLAPWKEAGLGALARRLWPAFAVSLAFALAAPFAFGRWSALAALGLFVAAWIISGALTAAFERLRAARAGGVGALASLRRQPASWYAMHLAHVGIAVAVIGITLVKGYEEERDVRMAPGDSVTVGGQTFRMIGVREVNGPNYRSAMGDVELSEGGRVLRVLHPEKRIYSSSAMPMTEAAIDAGITRDAYVSLGEPLGGGEWSVRVYYKPFIDWIWGGALLMALGGLVAIADRRYRIGARRAADRIPASGAEAAR